MSKCDQHLTVGFVRNRRRTAVKRINSIRADTKKVQNRKPGTEDRIGSEEEICF